MTNAEKLVKDTNKLVILISATNCLYCPAKADCRNKEICDEYLPCREFIKLWLEREAKNEI